jgi:hypothetical protein
MRTLAHRFPKNPQQKGLDFNQLLVKNPPLKKTGGGLQGPVGRQHRAYAAIITCFCSQEIP